jgi:hypothetical protein
MAIPIKAQGLGSESHDVKFDRKPDVCPICYHAIDPKQLSAAVVTGNPDLSGTTLEVTFQCTKRDCLRIFIGRYTRHTSQGDKHVGNFNLDLVVPTKFRQPSLPAEIAQVSPAFVRIFSQAAAAEGFELGEIAGVGYRKALEFLVKDYCVGEDPGAREEILKESLGSCIATRVGDVHVKECAKRAAWLGNDETHYVRRWEDKDIQDLKTLIELTMIWIRSSVLTKRYLTKMDSGRS